MVHGLGYNMAHIARVSPKCRYRGVAGLLLLTEVNMESPKQKEAQEVFDQSCRELAAAAVALKDAQERHQRAIESYMHAHGRAAQAGVLT